ncbi:MULTISPECIES: hypothetical protein [unclassified Caballeronia]|uniref:hypothetical protein n=1 Tax=unclassified Caballeronia TaxID=2646786 RepID=UPI002859664D|nr:MULTISPECIES: hypothetical protein [unclassified Caballeronia]MDR5771143.1 hypothetical protein [Caballeronia sp. LZ002]MDR5846580.1 hypothetical protein [Caballeronia sp. LZ003]
MEAIVMRKDIEAGEYLLALNAEESENESGAGYAVRVRVARIDGKAVHGSQLVDDSGEMIGPHGPFETIAGALAHGEAWGRHYIARVLAHGL